MANTYTDLVADAYAALDVVSRELSGGIPSVGRNSAADRVALGQTIRSHATRANSAGMDITPAMALPAAADQTIDNKPITMTKSRAFPFSWTGVERANLNAGPGFLTVKQDQIAQALRAGINEIELDVMLAAYKGGSRAYGTAATTPFVTNLADTAQLKKILDDNGAPQTGRSLVMSTTAGANVRTLSQLTKVNEAGDSNLLRQGTLLDVHGFMLKESAQVQIPTSGTAAGATTSAAALPIGTTSIPLAAAGTGTILAGDVITFADDTNKYVVASGTGAVSGATITIAEPGLRKAKAASTKAITVVAASARNIALTPNAIVLGTRLPDLPEEGDQAIMREVITDDRTGLSFELAAYPGFRMVTYHVSINWGVNVIKPEHIAVLLGEA